MPRWVAVLLGVFLGATTATALTDPFAELKGPIAAMEEWSYNVEEKFGEPVKILEGHRKEIYDSHSNPIETIEYTVSGTIKKRYVRTYDNGGRLLQVIVYNALGNLEGKTICEYEGNILFAKEYGPTGKLTGAYRQELDSAGRIIRMVLYDETGKQTGVTESSYAPDGKLLLTRIVTDTGEIVTSYSYNVEGMDVVTKTTIYVAGIKFTTLITGTRVVATDPYGNWTEKHVFTRKERFGRVEWVLDKVYERIFTYRDSS